jgi:hypothetical protein
MNTGEELFEMDEEEMVQALNSAMQEALKAYFEQNGPIVIPEEGVTLGELSTILNPLDKVLQDVLEQSPIVKHINSSVH